MSELMFQVRNSYSADSGDPSTVDGNDPKKYVGYFQSPDGHQLVFIFDRKTKNAELRCGDCGWNVIIEVIDAVPVGLEMWFGNAERLWLCACWMSANKQESVPSACGPRIRMMQPAATLVLASSCRALQSRRQALAALNAMAALAAFMRRPVVQRDPRRAEFLLAINLTTS